MMYFEGKKNMTEEKTKMQIQKMSFQCLLHYSHFYTSNLLHLHNLIREGAASGSKHEFPLSQGSNDVNLCMKRKIMWFWIIDLTLLLNTGLSQLGLTVLRLTV